MAKRPESVELRVSALRRYEVDQGDWECDEEPSVRPCASGPWVSRDDVLQLAKDLDRELLELRREVELSGVARLSPSSLPSVLYRPRLSLDGNAWCALYGEDLQVGVAGFGKSPAEAMAAFDAAWVREVQP